MEHGGEFGDLHPLKLALIALISSSSEAALRDSRRLKCCGEEDTREVS
jgi:hypothetical protein